MSNLSELLPSGGGQNLVEFVASGTLPNGKPVILNSDGTVEVVAETTTSIPAGTGSEYAFSSSSSFIYESSVAMLSDTKAIVTYKDSNVKACILNISGTTITAGTPVTLTSYTSVGSAAVTVLTSDKAVVAYYEYTGSAWNAVSQVLDISGSTITAGADAYFSTADSEYISLSRLTDQKALVAYKDGGNGNKGTTRILDVSGSTITVGTAYIFNSSSTDRIHTAALTSTSVLIVFRDNGVSNYGRTCVLSVSGTTITAGSEITFVSHYPHYVTVGKLTSTKAIVTYKRSNDSGKGGSCILDVSGTTVTAGSEHIFTTVSTSFSVVSVISPTKALVAYQNSSSGDYGTYCILNISGSTITSETPIVFNSGATTYIGSATGDSLLTTVAYRDDGNSSYGTAIAIQQAVTITTTNLTTANLIGITSEATSSGGTAKINTWGGINEAQTSLTIASDYYAQGDGTITTVSTSPAQKLGTAISTTTINIRDLP